MNDSVKRKVVRTLSLRLMQALGVFLLPVSGLAQDAPLPGATYNTEPQAPPAQANTAPAEADSAVPLPGVPVPGAGALTPAIHGGSGIYNMLPLSPEDAKNRLAELKAYVQVTPARESQTRVNSMCEWLVEMTEAHYKLANVFGRQDNLKPQSQVERTLAQKFGHLKNEAQLLKAELLINQNRGPEALGPLIDIVVNEPNGATGLSAYNKLKELGFSQDVPVGSTGAAPSPQIGSSSPVPVATTVASKEIKPKPKPKAPAAKSHM